ncbi:Putative RNA-directed DNA polymerase [Vibrio cholerae]|nr:Putative RNA-directed DNA polymerase [Vibrio cholerae]
MALLIYHIDDGLYFLDFNLRKYKVDQLIKPSKTDDLSFLGNLRELIKKHLTYVGERLLTFQFEKSSLEDIIATVRIAHILA